MNEEEKNKKIGELLRQIEIENAKKLTDTELIFKKLGFTKHSSEKEALEVSRVAREKRKKRIE